MTHYNPNLTRLNASNCEVPLCFTAPKAGDRETPDREKVDCPACLDWMGDIELHRHGIRKPRRNHAPACLSAQQSCPHALADIVAHPLGDFRGTFGTCKCGKKFVLRMIDRGTVFWEPVGTPCIPNPAYETASHEVEFKAHSDVWRKVRTVSGTYTVKPQP